MENKILTVSVAAYNVESTICKTIDSLIDERYIDKLDIIINDDGGIDQTYNIAKEYERRFPRSIRVIHKENGGYGSVINTNLAAAKGKYFKQLDGDDWFLQSELEEYLDLLDSIDDDCVITRTKIVREDTGTTRIKDVHFEVSPGKHRFDEVYFDSFLTMHSVTFKTSTIQGKDIKILEHCFYTDVQFVVSALFYAETFYLYPYSIYVYRQGVEGQSISWTGRKKHYKEHEMVIWKVTEMLNKMQEPHKKVLIEKRLINNIRAHMAYYYRFPISSKNYREYRAFGLKVHQQLPEIERQIATRALYWKCIIKSHYRLYLVPMVAANIKDKWKIIRASNKMNEFDE